MTEKRTKGFQNRLVNEKSPYLLQHADNPVEWYPWNEEAFEKAANEDKPIFLSIGYSTCHWCHVMAHESFENPEIAKLMNAAFISIKVDREERPDVDATYMAAAQMMIGTGGWPLTIIMTPDKKPFFAATYIPRESRYGRVGMLDLIPRVKQLWENERDKALSTADEMTHHLKNISHQQQGEAVNRKDVDEARRQLSELFDPIHGGFARAPKFPTPHNILFLLRAWKRTGDEETLLMVEKTLQKMRLGGIFDHLGFGFHRYSTDPEWLVPHFEKMLYDQALLAIAYTEAYQATKNEEYRETAEKILTYVLRDMQSPKGGFYSAEDADSEGVEGLFYVWTIDEVEKHLSADDAELFNGVFNITDEGNYLDEATKEMTGNNIMHMKKNIMEISDEIGIPLSMLKERLDKVRTLLFEARDRRVRPDRDDKIMADWNGLMIAALAKAGRVFDEKRYLIEAERAADFIVKRMMDTEERLLHNYMDGKAKIKGFLEDYAYFTWGLIELYESTFKSEYLKRAIVLTEQLIAHFWDDENLGFYHSPDDGETLIVRKKEVYDGATPSGNSVAALNLLRLSRITGNFELEKKAVDIGKAFSKIIKQYPAGYTNLLSSVEFLTGPAYEVVIVGDPENSDTKEMIRALRGEYLPNKVVLLKSNDEKMSDITQIAGFLKEYNSIKGKATAYICSNFSCKKPTTDPEQMLKLLRPG